MWTMIGNVGFGVWLGGFTVAMIQSLPDTLAEQKKAETEAAASTGILGGETMVFDGMEFVGIPPGEFLMGSTGRYAKEDEQPPTWVRISRGFYLGKYEVTQNEWQTMMGDNPSEFSGCGRCPAEKVSWNAVQEFVRRLNARTVLPATDRGGVGVCGASGDEYGHIRGECDGPGRR